MTPGRGPGGGEEPSPGPLTCARMLGGGPAGLLRTTPPWLPDAGALGPGAPFEEADIGLPA